MADSVVSFVLDHLSQLMAREAKLLCGVEDRIKSLQNELEMINEFLNTSKSKKGIEKKVVSQIRDVAHLAEDVIDTYVAKVAIHERRTMMGRLLHSVHQARLLHDVAEKIDQIKNTISEIRNNKIKYEEFQESNSQSTTKAEEEEKEKERAQLLHKLRRNVEEEDVVGFVRDSNVVIRRLLEGGSSRNVVSIIGMGGLGKTTLARKVYNSREVKQYFRCCAWVYVSDECRVKEIFLGLLKHLMPNLEYQRRGNTKGKKRTREFNISKLSEEELKKLVRECLERKRYLVVLDDLWKTQDWDELHDAFPDDNKGSRILITSRLKEVALHTSHHPPYYLQFLSEDESWELFCKKVFRGEEYSSDLEPLGKQIVQSCRGLPLSIVVLAGLLANKEKSYREWSKVVGHVNWYLTQDETQVKDIVLKLSYDNLPRRLKPCFLFLGIFPEDFEIPVRPLLQRWVAEGFIQETGNRDPDDVAEDYLYELIDRSLVQVAAMKTSGGVKTCHIHDLLRDLCISESKEDKVFQVCTGNNILISTKPRRLSIHCNMGDYISSNNNDQSCIRSLFMFGPRYFFIPSELKRLFKGFKLVRVLELGTDSCGGKIPSNLGDFIHLRYLRIDSQHVRIIPASILTLQNLQTVDLGCWRLTIPISFPAQIWKLKHLRHLYAPGPIKLRGHYSKPSEVMWNLQTMNAIVLDEQASYLIYKGTFPNLKNLGLKISSGRKAKWPKLLQSLLQLSHLSKLRISFEMKLFEGSVSRNYVNSMEWHIGCKPQEVLQSIGQLSHVTTLNIRNALDLLTCRVTFPPNVIKLTLTGISCVTDEGMDSLGNHTKLQKLRLTGGFWSDSFDLNCVAGRFPQLQVFEMSGLKVRNWKLGNSAMLCLQSLIIHKCEMLDGIPNELWSLIALRKVQVKQPSEAMAHMLQNLEMKDGVELIVEPKERHDSTVILSMDEIWEAFNSRGIC
ncbi:disease resistance protein RPP13 isoform X3 [Cajanus cajan]|uniref:disease resistance protein RPP13 isoform X1 n=1 Tax=Cajanus cajan TaxID=3821 RepID=UPI00098D87C0|nr:disease resistance protein RPP13 isoform X1 [Cajanus cajan]XP_020214659.1 disease resistance protein RPP13 isoform X2 [Cajanus cajan]XP_020214660.1 disease resistance protein RPP13 isoform X3 [Cajanus cajan]